jgi:hypothetical protein
MCEVRSCHAYTGLLDAVGKLRRSLTSPFGAMTYGRPQNTRNPPMRFEKKEFRNETINLNGNEFDHCQFDGCRMVFNGVGNVGLSNNNFKDCKWIFDGPAAATVAYMKALYGMGGDAQTMIIAMLEEVAPNLKKKH